MYHQKNIYNLVELLVNHKTNLLDIFININKLFLRYYGYNG